MSDEKLNDPVNHPSHYLKAAITIEPIELTARLDSCLGQALQYLFRAPYKGRMREDMEKALFYLRKEREVMAIDGTQVTNDRITRAYARVFYKHSWGVVRDVLYELFIEGKGALITVDEIERAERVLERNLPGDKKEAEYGVAAHG